MQEDDSNSLNYLTAIYVIAIGILYFVTKKYFLAENPFEHGIKIEVIGYRIGMNVYIIGYFLSAIVLTGIIISVYASKLMEVYVKAFVKALIFVVILGVIIWFYEWVFFYRDFAFSFIE